MGQRRSYTEDDKANAIALYVEHGGAEASRRTGIPDGTIKAWASRSGATSERAEQLTETIEARKRAWEDRRTEMAVEIGEVAHLALQRTHQALVGDEALMVRKMLPTGKTVAVIPSPADVKALATTMAILVDKAQLLTGGATSRSEHATAETVTRKLADVTAIRADLTAA